MKTIQHSSRKRNNPRRSLIHGANTTDLARETVENLVDQVKMWPEQMPKLTAKALIKFENVPCDAWSIGNRILMQFGRTGYTSDCRGYRQWQKVGRHVKKGAKARHILVPKTVKVEEENETTGEMEMKDVTIGFKCANVFAYEDTEGADISYHPKQLPPLHELAEIEYRKLQNAYGEFSPADDKITLSTEVVKTFFHELVHKYDNMTYEIYGQYADQELVAEFGAAVLAEIYGVESSKQDLGRTIAYIAQYTESHTPAEVGVEVMAMIDRIGTAVALILEDAQKLGK